MMKFKEVFDAIGPCGPKVGWEMEACYELERTAVSEVGQMVLVRNNGMFGEVEAGTYEVMIGTCDGVEESCSFGLTKEEATSLFESHLE
jgi:hypothetical protein